MSLRARSLALLALAGFSLASALALLGPGITKLRVDVVGLGGDPYQTLWRFHGLTEALRRGSLTIPAEPFRNLGPLPWLPLHLLVGEPLAYNLVWILSFPLTAVATYALARSLGFSRPVGVLAGMLATLAPYRLAQSLGHFGAWQLFWVPAVLAALVRWLRTPNLSAAVLLGLLLVGTAWTEHTLFLTALLGSAVMVAALAPGRAGLNPRRLRSGLVLGLLLAAGAIIPFWRDFTAVTASDSYYTPLPEQRLRFSPDPRALVSLPSFHLLRRSENPYGTSRATVADRVVALGAVALTAAVVQSLLDWRRKRSRTLALAGCALAGLLLALLPRAGGEDALATFPVLSAVRTVDRFLALPVVVVPLLAAQFALTRHARWQSVLLVGLLVLEILPRPPFPHQDAHLAASYHQLRDLDGAVLEVPAATDYLVASRALYSATVHGRPLRGSSALERVEDPLHRAALLRVPVVSDILLLRSERLERRTFFQQSPRAIAHAALASEGISAVVLHTKVADLPVLRFGVPRPRNATADELRAVRSFLTDLGLREEPLDEAAFLYRIPSWPTKAVGVVVVQGSGWDRSSRSAEGTTVARLTAASTFEVRVIGEQSVRTRLTFRTRAASSGSAVSLLRHQEHLQTIPLRSGETSLVDLGVLSPGRHPYTLRVDATGVLIENPTVTTDSASS